MYYMYGKFKENIIIVFCLILGYIKGVWLGYSDIQKEGCYVFMFNVEEFGYNNWYKMEFNNVGGIEYCVVIYV